MLIVHMYSCTAAGSVGAVKCILSEKHMHIEGKHILLSDVS